MRSPHASGGLSQFESLIRGYKPSWFYFSQITGCLASGVLHESCPYAIEFERLDRQSESQIGGKVVYHVKRTTDNTKSNKALLLVPGVGGDCKSFLV